MTVNFKDIIDQLRRKDGLPTKADLKNPEPLNGDLCIYGTKGTKGKTSRYFNWVHSVLKYKFYIPGLFLLSWFLGKRLEDDVDDKFHNRNLKVFNESWKTSMVIMGQMYNDCFISPETGNYKAYDLSRRMWLTIAMNDTATREFTNVFCHTLAQNMRQEYKGHKKVYHVFYDSYRVYDVEYLRLSQILMDNMFNLERWKDCERAIYMDKLNKELSDEAKYMLAQEYGKQLWFDLNKGFWSRLKLAVHLVWNYREIVRLAAPMPVSSKAGAGDVLPKKKEGDIPHVGDK